MDTLEREEFVSSKTRAAYDELCNLVECCAASQICRSGDVLIVNNYLSVHGRPLFTPNYDGTDRWLQRLLLKTDFRQTAKYREKYNCNVPFA